MEQKGMTFFIRKGGRKIRDERMPKDDENTEPKKSPERPEKKKKES